MKWLPRLLMLILLCSIKIGAVAATMTYVVTPAETQYYWKVDYILTNNGGPLFDGLTVYEGNGEIIIEFAPPYGVSSWGIERRMPDLGVPGYFEATFARPILVDEQLSFSAVVVSLEAPLSHFFELFVAEPFFILQSGNTSPVPDVRSGYALVAGLILTFALGRTKPKAGHMQVAHRGSL